MAQVCSEQLQLYAGIPDFSIRMFRKFMHLIWTSLTQFGDVAMVDPSFHRFHFGDHKLAFDFNVGPLPQQMHGLFARVRFLHSAYHRTFQEMVTYNFIENYFSSCFGPNATHIDRFLATRIEEVDRPLPPPPPATPKEARRKQEIEEEIQAVRPVPCNLPYTREEILEITSLLTAALEERAAEGPSTSRNPRKRPRRPPYPGRGWMLIQRCPRYGQH